MDHVGHRPHPLEPPEEAVRKIKSGQRIFLTGTCSVT